MGSYLKQCRGCYDCLESLKWEELAIYDHYGNRYCYECRQIENYCVKCKLLCDGCFLSECKICEKYICNDCDDSKYLKQYDICYECYQWEYYQWERRNDEECYISNN